MSKVVEVVERRSFDGMGPVKCVSAGSRLKQIWKRKSRPWQERKEREGGI
jgi:hypothetical protein